MAYIQPGKGLIMDFTINGIELLPFVNVMRCFESVCKQYLTAQVILFDTDNLMPTLNIVAGMPCTLMMMAPPNTVIYSPSNMKILKMKGEPAPGTLKFQVYTIDMVGIEYYQDRMNIVRNSFATQGTAAIAAIWGQYIGTPFSVDSGSSGIIGSQGGQPATKNGQKPFTAMYEIMKTLAGGQGNWLLYHDKDTARINQLETMLGSAVQENFIQGETWGSTFNNLNIYRSIVVAQLQAGRGDGGYTSGSQIAKMATQSLSVMDLGLGKILQTGMQNITSAAGGALQGISGASSQYGGRDNRQTINTSGIAAAVSPIAKTISEGAFSAAVRNGPQIALKVPLQTGLNVTVGKQIHASLLPPSTGDAGLNGVLLDRDWMVADLCHEIYQDDRELNATTNMQCVTSPTS
jgi:hypothetical protein